MSDEHEDQQGMTLEEFLRKVVGEMADVHVESEHHDHPEMKEAHAAIQSAIEVEYKALVERSMVADALRTQPDLTLAAAGRGWALHFLAARTANLLSKHTPGPSSHEFAAQKLEHDASCTRWAVRIADVVGRGEAVDKALEKLKDD